MQGKLRKAQRLNFESVRVLNESGEARLATGPETESDEMELMAQHAACQDYLFGIGAKPKVWYSLQEALDDFSRWGLEVVWGKDLPANVTIVREP